MKFINGPVFQKIEAYQIKNHICRYQPPLLSCFQPFQEFIPPVKKVKSTATSVCHMERNKSSGLPEIKESLGRSFPDFQSVGKKTFKNSGRKPVFAVSINFLRTDCPGENRDMKQFLIQTESQSGRMTVIVRDKMRTADAVHQKRCGEKLQQGIQSPRGFVTGSQLPSQY